VSFAAAGAGGTLQDGALLAHRIAAALTAGAVLLVFALVIALAVRPRRRLVVQPSALAATAVSLPEAPEALVQG
jgi:hypothetical protein